MSSHSVFESEVEYCFREFVAMSSVVDGSRTGMITRGDFLLSLTQQPCLQGQCPSTFAGPTFNNDTALDRTKSKELLFFSKCSQNVTFRSPNLSRAGFGFSR
jgi:hypothetical protein